MFKGLAHMEGPEMFMHSSGSGSQSQGDSTVLKRVKGRKFDRPIPVVYLKISFCFTVVVASLIYL